jgi:hypothetical protein
VGRCRGKTPEREDRVELDRVRRDPVLVVEEVEERNTHDLGLPADLHGSLAFTIWWRRYAVAPLIQLAVGASAIIVWPAAS